MIPTVRIATGFAESLLKSARPSTDPEPTVAEAFRRGLRLGLSLRRRPPSLAGAPFLREGGAPWPVTIAHPKPSSRKPKRRASQPTSSSNVNAPQAAATHATATRRYGARPHGGATSTPPPTPQASWTWSAPAGLPGRAPRRIGTMRSQCLISRGQRSPLHALKARRNLESSSGFLLPPVTVQFPTLTPGSRANMIRPSPPHHNLQPPGVPSAFRRGRISSRATQPVLSV